MSVGLSAPAKLLPVRGVRLASVAAGLRYRKRSDLVLVTCESGSTVAATFTRNRYVAAPVIVAREHLATTIPIAFLINAGQANAGTGESGVRIAQRSCELVAAALDCQPDAVLPFSTGVIGAPPPLDKIEANLEGLVAALDENNWLDAAAGIMTTDTVAKAASTQFDLNGVQCTVTGIAKGSGMIHPNMATMLSYVATDALVEQSVLDRCWQRVIADTFNRITVDGDTSTNDAAIIIATGKAGNPEVASTQSATYESLRLALTSVCLQLAQSIVRDAEGATKFVSITVTGGNSETDCLAIAFTVAHSPLVKTALFASDANWGRILAAVGRAPVDSLDLDKVDLYLGDVCVARKGAVAEDYTDEQGQAVMKREQIDIRIDLHAGEAETTVWTSDLSHDYVRINAEYRS